MKRFHGYIGKGVKDMYFPFAPIPTNNEWQLLLKSKKRKAVAIKDANDRLIEILKNNSDTHTIIEQSIDALRELENKYRCGFCDSEGFEAMARFVTIELIFTKEAKEDKQKIYEDLRFGLGTDELTKEMYEEMEQRIYNGGYQQ